MVQNIVQKYDLKAPLILYNRTSARTISFAASLPESKVQVATTLQEVAKANTILSCIADDPAMLAFINDILPFCDQAKLFIDCSTIHPETSDQIGAKLKEAGHDFVAMPVFGAPAMADAGQLVCVSAGPALCIERALSFASVVGRQTINLAGQPYGAALKLKIIGNTFILNMVNQLAEGHVLAESSGLGSELLHRFISAMLPGAYEKYSERMMSGDYCGRQEPLFAVDLAIKDACHALSLADDASKGLSGEVDLKNTKTGMERLRAVKEKEGAKGDLPGVYGVVREQAGLGFDSKESKKE